MFAASEIAALIDCAIAGGFPVPGRDRPDDPVDLEAVTLGQAMLVLARIGGCLNRRNDGPPGHQTVWEGCMRLVAIAQGCERIEAIGDGSAYHAFAEKRKRQGEAQSRAGS